MSPRFHAVMFNLDLSPAMQELDSEDAAALEAAYRLDTVQGHDLYTKWKTGDLTAEEVAALTRAFLRIINERPDPRFVLGEDLMVALHPEDEAMLESALRLGGGIALYDEWAATIHIDRIPLQVRATLHALARVPNAKMPTHQGKARALLEALARCERRIAEERFPSGKPYKREIPHYWARKGRPDRF
jgi:hypothetical protein